MGDKVGMPCSGDELWDAADCTRQSSPGSNNSDDVDDSEAWLAELLAYGRERQRRRFLCIIFMFCCVLFSWSPHFI